MMTATYYGHACVQFDFDGHEVLLDPFVTYNPLAKDIDIDHLNPEYIFLSHAHQDHVADLSRIQKKSQAIVAAPVETADWVRKQGISEDKVIEYNIGGTIQTTFGKAKMVIAIHSNSSPDGQYAGWPVGYVFFVGNQKIYFAGDTALTYDMKLLEDLQLDWAFLPIGGHYTMDVDDAIRAAKLINCSQIVGIHYNSFPPIRIDTQEAKDKFAEAGLQLVLPNIGETILL